jgi:hypothetical protein
VDFVAVEAEARDVELHVLSVDVVRLATGGFKLSIDPWPNPAGNDPETVSQDADKTTKSRSGLPGTFE